MTTFLQNFKDSSQEFKNVRSLVTAALLIALHTVLAYFVSFHRPCVFPFRFWQMS